MKLILQVLLVTANLLTSLGDDRRMRCDCHLDNISYRKMDISCGLNPASGQGSSGNAIASCAKEINGFVPGGYEYVDGLGFYKLFRTSRFYGGAYQRCRQDGAFLAVPNSTAEAKAIGDILRRNPPIKQSLIGIHDRSRTGTFRSIHGTPLDSLGYHEWAPGQPDNAGASGEPCVAIDTEGLYDDKFCDYLYSFVCHRPLTFKLPAGYKYFPKLGFYKHYTTPETYEKARKRCQDDGGHLAVLDTLEEAEAVINTFYTDDNVESSYVGMNDIEQEGTFVTETGKLVSSLAFINWVLGDPNNAGPLGQDCVTFHISGTYDDVQCFQKHAFFCEIPLPNS